MVTEKGLTSARQPVIVPKFNDNKVSAFHSVDEGVEAAFVRVAARTAARDRGIYNGDC